MKDRFVTVLLLLLILAGCRLAPSGQVTDGMQQAPDVISDIPENAESFAVSTCFTKEDVIYSIDLNKRLLAIDMYQLEDSGWIRFDTIVCGGDKPFDLTIFGAALEETPFYEGASGGAFAYQIEGQQRVVREIKLSLNDRTVFTAGNKFFSVSEINDKQGTILGYMVYSNERLSISDWTASCNITAKTGDVQIIRIDARVL